MEKFLSLLKKIIPRPIFEFFLPAYYFLLGILGNIIYGFPGKKMKIIAVTGTNGKSTTSVLIMRILEAAGYKVGLSSTVMFKAGQKEWVNETNKTALGRFQTYKLLNQMVRAGSSWAVVEVTAHGLVQNRVYALNPDIAVFTNLAPEHLDYFESMEEYKKAKGRLFAMLNRAKRKGVAKTSVLNADDHEFEYFAGFNTEQKVYFGLGEKDLPEKYYWAEDIKPSLDGTEFTIMKKDGQPHSVKLKLLGRFNVYNALAAFSSARAAGVEVPIILKTLENISGIPGRMEFIRTKNNITFVVDYAHTPDAFEALFGTLKEIAPNSRIIAVFGATGDRDRTKRPELGRIASLYSDVVILTNEEPYTEDPKTIIREVAAGIPEEKRTNNLLIIEDRRSSIKKALSLARSGDVITLTGMGHQNFAVFGEEKIPWNDKKVVLEVIAESE